MNLIFAKIFLVISLIYVSLTFITCLNKNEYYDSVTVSYNDLTESQKVEVIGIVHENQSLSNSALAVKIRDSLSTTYSSSCWYVEVGVLNAAAGDGGVKHYLRFKDGTRGIMVLELAC
jgi:hypothetical protein